MTVKFTRGPWRLVQHAGLYVEAEAAEALLSRQGWRDDGFDPEAVLLRQLRAALARVRRQS